MIGFEEDYEAIEEESKSKCASYLSFGEWIFFAFAMEPQSDLDKALGKLIPTSVQSSGLATKYCRDTRGHLDLKKFATELLESGELIFRMSEKYRKRNNSAGGMAK
jgi:hypothetical protein